MDSLQPSLWDNVALENGYRKLNELKFGAALREFSEAFQMDMGRGDAIRQAIATAEYWGERMGEDAPAEGAAKILARSTAQLLEDLASYRFDDKMQRLRQGLLLWITDEMLREGELAAGAGERAFDLLLECKAYDKAKAVVAVLQSEIPGKTEWLYMEAQVLWRAGEKPAATHLVARALLSDPGSLAISRIEHPGVKEMIATHGAEKTPAYGWVHEILPLVELPDELVILHEAHEQALLAYDALRSAHLCLKNGDERSSVSYRKNLKELDHALFDAYMPQARRRI